ncbi:hypothetical protein ABBQ38_012454, partial [Trebouxia sp. C0009 RCD-2024]
AVLINEAVCTRSQLTWPSSPWVTQRTSQAAAKQNKVARKLTKLAAQQSAAAVDEPAEKSRAVSAHRRPQVE